MLRLVVGLCNDVRISGSSVTEFIRMILVFFIGSAPKYWVREQKERPTHSSELFPYVLPHLTVRYN